MRIVKILNNNAFISVDENGKEIIVMGRGAAFGRKSGQQVELPEGAQVFSNQDKELNEKMKNVVANIPLEYIAITEKIVALLRKVYNKQVHDIIYITLTEHIQGAVERHKSGVEIENPLLSEIRRFYREEYEVAEQTIAYIKKEFGIAFSKDEAGYIAFHIVNAELDGGVNNVAAITRLVQEMMNVIKYYMQLTFDENSLHYDRLLTHLKYFAQRVMSNNAYKDTDDDLFDLLKGKYVKSYQCSCKLKTLVEKQFQYQVSREEQMYLMIHIEKLSTK